MKKLISAVLALALILSSCSLCFATSQNKVLQTVKALGIMSAEADGSMNTSSKVTRAQLAKMLVAASGTKTSKTSAAGFSVYKDVKKTGEYSKYIYQVTKAGYMTGYTDSTFRPDKNVKLEEICVTLIKLLGYTSNDVQGSYPSAYIDKADELGLLDNVSCSQGQYITRGDCANMFYNCLLASSSTGKVFGTTLGCTVNNGVVSYTLDESDSDNEDGFYVGVISNVSQSVSSSSSTGVATSLTVSCTDGISRSYTFDKKLSYSSGSLVQIKVDAGDATISSLNSKSFEGKVNTAGTYVGEYKLAEDAGILESDSYGNTLSLSVDDIKGLTLSSDNVKYYSLNTAGSIDTLVLDDATGMLWTNVYMTSVTSNSVGTNLSASYSYISEGKTKSLNTNGIVYSADTGGVMIKFSPAGEVQSMKTMNSVNITSMTESTAMVDNVKYSVSDDVQVYVRSEGDYYLTDVASVSGGEFKLQGWYTKVGSNNVIQIVIATKISN